MREGLYEESATPARGVTEAKWYTAFRVIAIIAFVVAALMVAFAFNYVPIVLAGTVDEETGQVYTAARVFYIAAYFVFVALMAGTGALFWKFKNRYNVSYDYIFVEDELRVSRVFNGVRRKFYKRFNADMILKMGKCANDSFHQVTAGMGKKQIIYLTSNREPAEGKEFFYMLYSSTTEKSVYILECKTQLIEYVVRAAGRNKWESR